MLKMQKKLKFAVIHKEKFGQTKKNSKVGIVLLVGNVRWCLNKKNLEYLEKQYFDSYKVNINKKHEMILLTLHYIQNGRRNREAL